MCTYVGRGVCVCVCVCVSVRSCVRTYVHVYSMYVTHSSRAHFRLKCRQTLTHGVKHISDQNKDRHLQFESTFQTICRQTPTHGLEHTSDQSKDKHLQFESTF